MRFLFSPFFDNESNTGLGGAVLNDPDKEKFDDDTALLDNLIDTKHPEKKEKEDDKDDEEEVIDDKEDLLDDKKDDEKEDELDETDTNARGLDLAKIKEKYPDFAKTNEFRELRNAYHREAQYTELFPTIEDAREAAENNDTFNKINNDLINNGDITSTLNAIKEASPESLKKVATGFLDTVAKLDPNLHTEIITPVVKRLARQMYNAGQNYLKRNADSDDGKALVATARNIMQHFFENSDDIDKDEPKVDNTLSEKEKDLQQREQAIRVEKYTSALTLCIDSADKRLDKQILEGLDPDGKFNEFTRDTLLEKIKNEVKDQINKDSLHMRKMTSLWKRAEQEGYNRESLSRIVSAYLERARPIIPTVRNRFRSIAIKGKSSEENNTDKGLRLANKGRSGRAPENDGKTNMKRADPKKIDYKHTSDEDIFNGNVKLKAN